MRIANSTAVVSSAPAQWVCGPTVHMLSPASLPEAYENSGPKNYEEVHCHENLD